MIILVFGGALPLAAQDVVPQEPAEPPAAPVLTPPRLVEFVEATYPAEAEAAELEAGVLLELTIGADGRVTDVVVVEAAGNGFDESAAEAVQLFVFEPARRDGEPIAARIRYRYVFELRAPEPIPEETEPDQPPPPDPGRIEGRLLASEDQNAISSAEVILTNPDQTLARRALTDEEGRFRFDGLPPGPYQLRVVSVEYGELTQQEEVTAGEVAEITYRMRVLEDDDAEAAYTFGATAVVDPPPREITRRTIRQEELTRIPGTRGDALRAVELLPGIARPPGGSGLLLIRGTAPGDSEVFFNGVPVPLLYHFGGLTSFINSRLLSEISLYPGNFSGKYGRRSGGVLEVSSRDPQTDRFHGAAEFSAIDAWVLAEGPITDNWSMAGGFRRSIIDVVFEYVVPEDVLATTQAPVYYDYQLFNTWRPTEQDRVRFNFYGSDDRLALFADEPLGDDPGIVGDIGISTRFNYSQVSWFHQYNEDLDHDFEFLFGPTDLKFNLGPDLKLDAHLNTMYLRAEWYQRLSPNVRLIYGTDQLLVPYDFEWVGPPPRQAEGGGPDPSLASEETLFFSTKGTAYRPGFYVESDMLIHDDFRLLLALRLDYYHDIRDFSFNPRANFLWNVREDLVLKAGAGMYSQPPEFYESDPELGNPEIEALHSVHLAAGADYTLTRGMFVGVEGFYKYIWDRPVGTVGGVPPFFVNEGIGRIYGAEFSGRIEPTGRNYFGFLAYTLSRSERRDRPGDDWRLFDYDQTHIFTASFVYRFPKMWELGGTLRLISGNPSTPIEGGITNLTGGFIDPIPGEINSVRDDFFQRLDIRVQKTWLVGAEDGGRISFFLDIQNVYNAMNQEGYIYDRYYRASTTLNGLPIIPSLGLRGEY